MAQDEELTTMALATPVGCVETYDATRRAGIPHRPAASECRVPTMATVLVVCA